MEFPNLGEHCQEQSCKLLDFLPFKCDSCKKVLCKDHISYSKHECNQSNLKSKDFQVPLCPLCNQPVPYKRNELPDIVMSAHIDRDCKSDPAEVIVEYVNQLNVRFYGLFLLEKERRRKIYSNKCSMKGCKQKELVPITCQTCKKNYCLRHRIETDHDCQPLNRNSTSNRSQPQSSSLMSEINLRRLNFFERFTSNNKQPSTTSSTPTNRNPSTNQRQVSTSSNARTSGNQSIQPNNMSESEALEYALRLSMTEKSKPSQNNRIDQSTNRTNETEEEMLARALALSEQEYQEQQRRQQQNASNTNQTTDNSCSIN